MPLSPADYHPQIDPVLLAQLAPEEVRQQAETSAMQELMTYWQDRFDVQAIFDPEPVHPLVRLYWVDVALYHLYSRAGAGSVPAVRRERYQAALQWAAQVAAGELNLLLPRAQQGNPAQNVPFYLHGGASKIDYR